MRAGMVTAKWAVATGLRTLAAYKRECRKNNYEMGRAIIVETVVLDDDAWKEFTKNLLVGRDWLRKKGGTVSDEAGPWNRGVPFHRWSAKDIKVFRDTAYRLVIEVVGPNEFIYVDPQKTDRAKYVGLPTEKEPSMVEKLKLDDEERPPEKPGRPPKNSGRLRIVNELFDRLQDSSTEDDW